MRFLPSLLLIITIVILSDFVQWSSACRWCEGEECNVPPPNNCPFGEYINRCKRRACLKGPGEKCGGPTRNSFGECATGTYCHKEGRCYGCFLDTFDCYPPLIETKINQY